MRVITCDVESFWSTEYSLSKMSPLQYVMGDQFELQLLSLKFDDEPTRVYFGDDPELMRTVEQIDWSQHAVCGQNMLGFDSYVLAYRLGIRPRLWICTQAMARPIHAKVRSLSLKSLVEHYGLGTKDNTALMQTKGRRLADFTAAERRDMAKYNRDDTDQCRGLFLALKPHYTAAELWQIDAITRMRTEPQFVLDSALLGIAASVERSNKHKALLDLARMLRDDTASDQADIDWEEEDAVAEWVRERLASAPKFSALLEQLGVEVPTKPSPTNIGIGEPKMIPALAKTDEAFLALQEHDNPIVAAAARTRLDVKSTLLESRIEKFQVAGACAGGRLPIPIRYCGADTTGRDSGEEYNPQNLPRISKKKPRTSDALRRSLTAGPGKRVIVADQSGIELRVNHFLWKVPSSMEMYRASPDKADLYRAFASSRLFVGVPPERIDGDQRQIGKVAQLGLGFGSGALTFQRIARVMGGIDMPLQSEGDELSAERVVLAWRAEYPEICDGWRVCGNAISWVNDGREMEIDSWGLVHTCAEGLVLPSKRLIRYPELHTEDDGTWPDGRKKRSWFYGVGRHKARITGPKVTENIVQALARDSIFDCAVEFFKLTGLRPALRVHDELVYVVDEVVADEMLALLQRVMRTPPKWWPELVVWSEGGSAGTYGDAK